MAKANALVIGSGAREHTLVDFLLASPSVDRVWCYPGNGGTSLSCQPIHSQIKLDNPLGLLMLAEALNVDLTIVGPELPAIHGVADVFEAAGRKILCPSEAAAHLEGSKIWAKRFMSRHMIPTAPFDICYTPEKAIETASARDWKCVIKGDGLAGGKGVYVCLNHTEVMVAIGNLMVHQIHGNACSHVIVEDLLVGVESSFFVLVDGQTFIEFGTAGDHKRAYDHDEGPMTGGMGAFWPCPYVMSSEELQQDIIREIVEPTIAGMAEEGLPYQGFLYIGLMLTAYGPKVLEYNVRMGDPEAQVVIPAIDTSQIDSFELLLAAATGNLGKTQIPWHNGTRVGVVMTTANYPGKEGEGFIRARIEGPIRTGEGGPDVSVYHAATLREGNDFWATPGRVLTVSARGENYSATIDRAYSHVAKIGFSGKRNRSDIGKRAEAAMP